MNQKPKNLEVRMLHIVQIVVYTLILLTCKQADNFIIVTLV